MTRHIAIFTICFVLAALATAVIRTVLHKPYAAVATPVAPPAPVAPAVAAAPAPAPAPAAPVNTICPICGMDVDPSLPTATWEGRTIGFGCRACPPKFAADPAAYGPAALKNQVVE